MPKKSMIEFATSDGHMAQGYLAEPDSGSHGPAIVVIHEWWGLQDQIKHICDRYAEAGFRALGVDLYGGEVAKNAERAGELMGSLDFKGAAINIVGGAVRWLKEGSRRVGVTGYCMGGVVTVLSAAWVEGVDAAVAFYGLPDPKSYDSQKITIPFLAHFANRDEWCTPEKAKAFTEALKSFNTSAQSWFYEADHAFCNDRRPEVYSAEAAAQAWGRTVTFFKDQLT
jgi:carboxymethylenebutenolidase